jgi:hypothetical protein
MRNGYRFRSWVPTTTGHLSFRNVGQSRKGIKASSVIGEFSDAEHYRMACAQFRANRDGRLPLRLWCKLKAKFFRVGIVYHSYYVMVARTVQARTPYIPPGFVHENEHGRCVLPTRLDSRGALRGTIFAINYGNDRLSHASNKKLYQDACQYFENYNYGPAPALVPGVNRYREILRRLSSKTVIDFVLYRTGEVQLNVRSAEVPDTDEVTEVRQAYLFLKDCAHVHHHHPIWDDQYIPVVEQDEGDQTWRRKVLWDLVKAAGQLRRAGDWRRRNRAFGILSYVQSFQFFLARVRVTGGGYVTSDEISTYSFDSQKQSLDTSEKFDLRRSQFKMTLFASAIAAMIAISSISVLIFANFYKSNGYRISFETVIWICGILALFIVYFLDRYVSERSVVESIRRLIFSTKISTIKVIDKKRNILWIIVFSLLIVFLGLMV